MKKDLDIRIVVLQRGWVLVGEFSEQGEKCHIKNGAVIRLWGTDKGLGQIAFDGPQDGTILDKEPESEFHISQVIRTIKCEKPELWQKAIK